MKIIARW